MSYNSLAYWYDDLNVALDKQAVFDKIISHFNLLGINAGIIADLGCGTGENALRLAASGYDVLAVDSSPDMLSVLIEKMGEDKQEAIQVLQQDLAKLDLYGTIVGAICMSDTLNHLSPPNVIKALERISLFLEPGGAFIFDANTPYKHSALLNKQEYILHDDDGHKCVWSGKESKEALAIEICMTMNRGSEILFKESFLEYTYPQTFWQEQLPKQGFTIKHLIDGETYDNLHSKSERYFIVAIKDTKEIL